MITVRVLDRDNRPVTGLAVQIASTYDQDAATATTNQEGIAEFELRPNEYNISIDRKLFKTSYLGSVGNILLYEQALRMKNHRQFGVILFF